MQQAQFNFTFIHSFFPEEKKTLIHFNGSFMNYLSYIRAIKNTHTLSLYLHHQYHTTTTTFQKILLSPFLLPLRLYSVLSLCCYVEWCVCKIKPFLLHCARLQMQLSLLSPAISLYLFFNNKIIYYESRRKAEHQHQNFHHQFNFIFLQCNAFMFGMHIFLYKKTKCIFLLLLCLQ